jgi:hypothetical protein
LVGDNESLTGVMSAELLTTTMPSMIPSAILSSVPLSLPLSGS